MLRPDRIRDIKSLRKLTVLLGKLGIKSCYHVFNRSSYSLPIGVPPLTTYVYGYGLADCKALMERKHDYDTKN